MTREEFEQLYIGYEEHPFGLPYVTPATDGSVFFINDLRSENTYTAIPSLNIQTSKYHKESVLEHVAMVVARVDELCDKEYHDNEFRFMITLIALLHDVGKKYTVQFNKNGEICYYGHEYVSACIVEKLLPKVTTPEGIDDLDCVMKKQILSVINTHLQPKLLKDAAYKYFMDGFMYCEGERAYEYLIMLSKCDCGISNDNYSDEDVRLIRKGNRIINDYLQYL